MSCVIINTSTRPANYFISFHLPRYSEGGYERRRRDASSRCSDVSLLSRSSSEEHARASSRGSAKFCRRIGRVKDLI